MRSMAFSGFCSKTPNFDLISLALKTETSLRYTNIYAYNDLSPDSAIIITSADLYLNKL